jgi:hypothetical protein
MLLDATATTLALTAMARPVIRLVRERRALTAYERCRSADSNAGHDISRIIESFHPCMQSDMHTINESGQSRKGSGLGCTSSQC